MEPLELIKQVAPIGATVQYHPEIGQTFATLVGDSGLGFIYWIELDFKRSSVNQVYHYGQPGRTLPGITKENILALIQCPDYASHQKEWEAQFL